MYIDSFTDSLFDSLFMGYENPDLTRFSLLITRKRILNAQFHSMGNAFQTTKYETHARG